MGYSLEKICSKTVTDIRTGWTIQLESLGDEGKMLISGIERTAGWCEKEIENTSSPLSLMAICEAGTDAPRAILEITDARKSKDPSYKFLNIFLEPRLILDYKDEIHHKDVVEITKVVTFAFVEVLKMAIMNKTEKLKIYGRSAEMLSVFDTLVGNVEQSGSENLYRQGKWLVIEIKR